MASRQIYTCLYYLRVSLLDMLNLLSFPKVGELWGASCFLTVLSPSLRI